MASESSKKKTQDWYNKLVGAQQQEEYKPNATIEAMKRRAAAKDAQRQRNVALSDYTIARNGDSLAYKSRLTQQESRANKVRGKSAEDVREIIDRQWGQDRAAQMIAAGKADSDLQYYMEQLEKLKRQEREQEYLKRGTPTLDDAEGMGKRGALHSVWTYEDGTIAPNVAGGYRNYQGIAKNGIAAEDVERQRELKRNAAWYARKIAELDRTARNAQFDEPRVQDTPIDNPDPFATSRTAANDAAYANEMQANKGNAEIPGLTMEQAEEYGRLASGQKTNSQALADLRESMAAGRDAYASNPDNYRELTKEEADYQAWMYKTMLENAQTTEEVDRIAKSIAQQKAVAAGKGNADRFAQYAQLEDAAKTAWDTAWYRQKDAEYAKIPQAEDFGEYGYSATWDGNRFGFGADRTYEIVNRNAGNESLIAGYGLTTSGISGLTDEEQSYAYMTDEERAIYNHLYASPEYGKEKAEEYLEYLWDYRLGEIQENAKLARDEALRSSGVLGNIAANIASVGSSVVSGVGAIDLAVQKAKNAITGDRKPMDTHSPYQYASKLTQQTRANTAAEMNARGTVNVPLLGEVGWGNLYQVGMSIADSLAARAVGGGGGASTGILGASAATAGMQDAKERGADDTTALIMGALNGAFEAVFEKVSLDSLIKMNSAGTIKAALGNVAKQMGIEASEEMFTTIANTIADELVMADKSEISTTAEQLQQEGYTREEAEALARRQWLQGFLWDGIGGAISGGFMAGGQQGAQSIMTGAENRQTGKSIISAENVNALTNIAKAMNEGSKARQMADKLGKDAKPGEVGALYRQTVQELGEEVSGALKTSVARDVEKRLRELGEHQNVRAVAAAIVKMYGGEGLSRAEQQSIAQSLYGIQVEKEMLDWEAGLGEDWANASYAKSVEKPANAVRSARKLTEAKTPAEVKKAATEATAAARAETAAKELRIASEEQQGDGLTGIGDVRGEITAMDEKGGITVTAEDGTQATGKLADAEFPSRDAAILASGAAEFGTDGAAVLKLYNGGQQVGAYLDGALRAYQAGQAGRLEYDKGVLNPVQARAIYDMGRSAESKSTAAEQKRYAGKRGSGKVDISRIREKVRRSGKEGLTQAQRQDLQGIAMLARSMKNVDFVIYESEAGEDGRYVVTGETAMGLGLPSGATAPNGAFDAQGRIWLDINAGKMKSADDLQTSMLRTAGHELTHYIRAFGNTGDWNALREFVVRHMEQMGEGLTFDEMVDRNQGAGMQYDDAVEETVANACEMMLKDSRIVNLLAEERPKLFVRVKEWIDRWLAKVQEAFRGVQARSAEARAMEKWAGKLQEIWDEALKNAVLEQKTRETNKTKAAAEEVTLPGAEAAEAQTEAQAEASTGIELQDRSKYSERMNDIIDGYLEGVDEEILKYVQDIYADSEHSYMPPLAINTVNARQQSDLHALLNVDFGDYENMLGRSAVEHIRRRHGKTGQQDRSMADIHDIARMGWILENYDDVHVLVNAKGNPITSKAFRLENGKYAPQVIFSKKINGVYYLVEAVPENAKKRLWVVSAYINKKDAYRVPDAYAPSFTSETGAGFTSNDIVREPDRDVNPAEGENFNNAKFSPRRAEDISDRETRNSAGHRSGYDAELAQYSKYGIDWMHAYDRWYRDDTPMSRAGYAMFYKGELATKMVSRGSRTGQTLYIYYGQEGTYIEDLRDKIREAWEETVEDDDIPDGMERFANSSGDEIADEFNPEDIVDSAGAFDDEQMVMWLWENVLEPNGIYAVYTMDGAIVFDESLIEKHDISMNEADEDALDYSDAVQKLGYSYSVRKAGDLSDREILAGAFEGMARNATELDFIARYRKNIDDLNRMQGELDAVKSRIRERMYAKGPRDASFRDEQTKDKNRAQILNDQINRMDKKLLEFEAAKPLKDVVDRERTRSRKTIKRQYKKKLERYQAEREVSRKKAGLRYTIRRSVRSLDTALRKSADSKHVPDELRGPIGRLCQMFLNQGAFAGKDIAEIAAAYAAMAEDKALSDSQAADLYDPDVEDMLQELAKRLGEYTLADMPLKDLQEVQDMVDHFQHIVEDSNTIFIEGRAANLEQTAKQIEQEMIEAGLRKNNALNNSALWRMMREGMMRPEDFFDHIGGTMGKLGKAVLNGETDFGIQAQKAKDFFTETQKKYKYAEWGKKKEDATRQLLVVNQMTGKEDAVTLTLGQAMSIYALNKREKSNTAQQGSHMQTGGIQLKVQADRKGNILKYTQETGKSIALTENAIDEIGKWLTDEQKAYVNEMVRYLSEDMSALGNEVSKRMHGYSKFTEKYYFPYAVSGDFNRTKLGGDGQVSMLKNFGFTKRLTFRARKPLAVDDFTAVCAGHVNQMLSYHAFAEAQDAFMRAYDYMQYNKAKDKTGQAIDAGGGNSIKSRFRAAYGQAAATYIRQFMADLYGGAGKDPSRGMMDAMMRKFKASAVMMNLSVAIQQPSAIARAFAEIDPKYFVGGAVERGGWKQLKQYAGTAVIKDMGRYDTGMGQTVAEWLAGGKPNESTLQKVSGAIDSLGGWAPGKMDQITWLQIWNAVKRETAAKTKLTGEALLTEAGKRFDQVTRRTQVYDSILAKSQMMRSQDAGVKAITSFMAEPTVTYNMLMNAVMNRKKNPRGTMGKMIGAVAVASVLNVLLKSLIGAMRDKDEDKTWAEKYLSGVVSGIVGSREVLYLDNVLSPITMLPMVKDAISVFQGYDVTMPWMNVVVEGYRAYTMLGSDKKTPYQKVQAVAGFIGNICGVPIKNVWRDVDSVILTFARTKPLKETSAEGMKYALLTGLGYDDSDAANVHRMLAAYAKGDKPGMQKARERLEAAGLTEKEIKSKAKSRIREMYLGGIGGTQTAKMLAEFCDMDANDAYFQMEAWDFNDQKGEDSEETYSRYADVHAAIDKGGSVQAAEKELLAHGYSQDDIDGEMKSYIGKQYREGAYTKSQAESKLKKYCGMEDANEIYWQMDKWEYMKKNGGAEGYSKYDALYAAVNKGGALEDAVQEYLDKGDTWSDIDSEVKSYLREQYVNGEISYEVAADKLVQYYGSGDEGFNDDALYLWKKQADYRKETGEGGTSAYCYMYDYISSGDNKKLTAEINDLLAHGKKKSNIATSIVNRYETEYRNLKRSGKTTEAANLKKRVLQVCGFLGYNKNKAVAKWDED